ncbi:MAG: hypothetical protein EP329_20155 [Deltaproteobacteria bacterium]|nr:MAG: hypothetical protein EP329_20155 [Deltaproteobacteria bacterium]
MTHKGTWARRRCQRAAWLATISAAVLLALGAGRQAHAAADEDDASLYFGAFWGVAVHTGLVLRADGGPDEAPGPLLGVSARLATLLSLLDAELSLRTARYGARDRAGSEVDVARYSVALDVHLHPLFMAHLQNDNFAFWRGALYVSIGAGLEVLSSDAPGIDELHAAFGWHLGAGTDIPLGDVTHGWGLWLGLSYRYGFLGADSGVPGLGDFDEHTVLVSLGYRNNDIRFARFPRP